jgi:hypothetical protein
MTSTESLYARLVRPPLQVDVIDDQVNEVADAAIEFVRKHH